MPPTITTIVGSVRRRPRGWYVVATIVALAVVVEIPLVAYILTRDDGAPVAAQTKGASSASQAATTLPPHPMAGHFKPDDTTLAGCSEQTCYEQAYGNIAYRQGPKAALALVEKQYAGGADPSCHRIVHMIGAAALTRNKGNVARTFAQGASTCWSGYYHGVLIRAFADVKSFNADTLAAKSRALCSSRQVGGSSWLSYQCLHGLGHGLMITTGYQLPLSLDVCRRLATTWARTSCKGGVFMENFVTSMGGQSPWVRDSDPLYPCDWVGERDKYTCYQQAATRIIRVVGLDWQKIAQACAEAESTWRDTCFGSFGQNASVQNFRKPEKIVATCGIARPYSGEQECIRYAAMDIAGTYESGKQAASLCDLSGAELRGGCYEAIGHMLRYLRNTNAHRRAACRALTSDQRHVDRCIAGTSKTTGISGLTGGPVAR
jgi:hypothetical protein